MLLHKSSTDENKWRDHVTMSLWPHDLMSSRPYDPNESLNHDRGSEFQKPKGSHTRVES